VTLADRSNYGRLIRDEAVKPRSTSGRSWTSRGVRVSVMTSEDAGVDADWPWIASCDTHGEMIANPTRAAALAAARHRDWCSGCRINARGDEE
jgi:hypothetical protein